MHFFSLIPDFVVIGISREHECSSLIRKPFFVLASMPVVLVWGLIAAEAIGRKTWLALSRCSTVTEYFMRWVGIGSVGGVMFL